MVGSRARASGTAALVCSLVTSGASGIEPLTVGGDAVRIDITEASSLLYNTDNRNTRPGSADSLADDHWALFYNRLNVQASFGKWQAGLRVDSALFPTSPHPADIALTLLELRRGSLDPPFSGEEADFFVQKTFDAGEQLSNRYVNWVYPAKWWVGWSSPNLEATAGDFYAQLGRGLVLSVRKLDELSSDTTLRGGRATGRLRQGPLRFELTALGGSTNPLRIDEASGRYLSVDDSVTPGAHVVTEAGMPRSVETDFVSDPQPSFAPDRIVGAELEGGIRQAKLGVRGVLLDRQPARNADLVRTADTIRTGSVSLDLPDLDGHGAAYVEVAGQELEHSTAPETNLGGHAVYLNVTLHERPVTLTAEGKHYRRFFPLLANVDIGSAREFVIVQYSAPPTTEAFFVDTELEGFNTCVTGGRTKADVELGGNESVFLWVGRYFTWAESVTNERCEVNDDNLNRVWDIATGFELTSQRRRSRATFSVGARVDETDRTIPDGRGFPTNLFYQESYLRYDVMRHLGGAWSLEFQGWHRRRLQNYGGPLDPYYQSQHLTGVGWNKLKGALGFELDTDPQTPDTYFNGQIAYQLDPGSSISLFVGQRRGGLRCVGGVCRVFPPFEGARLDLTLRL